MHATSHALPGGTSHAGRHAARQAAALPRRVVRRQFDDGHAPSFVYVLPLDDETLFMEETVRRPHVSRARTVKSGRRRLLVLRQARVVL